MKKTLKIVGLVILVLVIGVVGLLAAAFMGRQSITDGAEASGMRIVKDGIVSVGVIPSPIMKSRWSTRAMTRTRRRSSTSCPGVTSGPMRSRRS
jgi:hypothetical protein